MERSAQQRGRVRLQPMWGPLTRFGLLVAAVSAALDQASKLWLLYVFDLPARAPVRLAPFLDLVMTWNKGISYGLFQQDGPLGQGVLLAIKAAAVVLLLICMARSPTSSFSTSRPRPTGSTGMFLIWPTPPSLPAWPDSCMNRCWGTAPQKRPDPQHNRGFADHFWGYAGPV